MVYFWRMNNKLRLFYLLIFGLAILVNFAGINTGFFTDDPGLYASIAKNLIYKHDFLQLFTYSQDWLDKPHFPFWMAAISFKIFGIGVWAYRLPALLFFLLGVVYTWLFANKYYSGQIAAVAVLILMTSQYVIMGNTDVRAEPYLLGMIIAAIYHTAQLKERFGWADLLLAALFTACAIMTKGIFVLVAIYGSILGQVMFDGQVGKLFSLRFIGLYVLTALLLAPEIYALYIQFDLHPEKLVFDKHGVAGIRWFLWDSQFGRFINKGPISQASGGDIFFYVHTLLWAFAPWCLMFFYAIYKRLRDMMDRHTWVEYYSLSGALLLLLLFSLSKFQLPFYTNAVFPLFAIITAPYIHKQLLKLATGFRAFSQWLYIIAFVAIVVVIDYFLKPTNNLPFYVALTVLLILIIAIFANIKQPTHRTFLITCAAALFANYFLITALYPQLVAYNGQITAANYINQPALQNKHIYSLKQENNVFQFYTHRPVDYAPMEKFDSLKTDSTALYYASQRTINYLNDKHWAYHIDTTFINYPQERILPNFVNQNKRNTVLDKVYLISK